MRLEKASVEAMLILSFQSGQNEFFLSLVLGHPN
jgi:hypothetical protein